MHEVRDLKRGGVSVLLVNFGLLRGLLHVWTGVHPMPRGHLFGCRREQLQGLSADGCVVHHGRERVANDRPNF